MRAIVYVRVSSDQSGEARSVQSQEKECRAVCEREGWEIAEVIEDNDLSASKFATKQRPGFQRLLKILREGDVLVVWEASRLSRDLGTYIALRDLCVSRGVSLNYSGQTVDLEGLEFVLGGAMAEQESQRLSKRVLRGKRAAAEAGRPAGRPVFGYKRRLDPATGRTLSWEVDPVDGPIAREVIDRVLAGESLWSITRDLTARGIQPRQDMKNSTTKWRPQPLRDTLVRPSYAGLRVHQGQVAGPGNWPALVSLEEHERLKAILLDPNRRTTSHRGSEPRHLLSGIATCGICGDVVRFRNARNGSHKYLCTARSCIGRRVDHVDALVAETILARLERPDAAKLFSKKDDGQLKAAIAEAQKLRDRLKGFVDKAIIGELSPETLARIEAELLPKIEAAEARTHVTIDDPLVARLAGPDARETWEAFSVVDRRTVVKSLLNVVINRTAARGGNVAFVPEDIDISWH